MLKKLVISTCLALCSMTVFAAEGDTIFIAGEEPIWSSVITLTGGVAWAGPGQNQYLYPYPYPLYERVIKDSKTKAVGTGGLFFGLQKIIFPNIIGEFGLGVVGLTDANVSGHTFIVGAGQEYSYTYQVNHGRIELKGKLIGTSYKAVQPYLSCYHANW